MATWIKLSEKQPDQYSLKPYIVCLLNYMVIEMNYLGDGRFYKHGFPNAPCENNPVIWWREMPNPPRKPKNSN